ncbi:MAG: hypothetical protein HOM25_17580 [Rhodospirillaceae bacterium]|jgi:hypothetical protein|nr:hypothetical protein [Rhodospirillaceae bacterium]MBT5667708.1 hypothetical protein [Rhodospirillaceae bacterium]MBT5812056.1 hypothetical protein [Rhodospirillaceae bacterium]
MIKTTKTFAQNLSANISNNIERYGFGAIALIILIELVWAASVLVPVLYLIATLIGSLKSWLAILPGFWGGVTFLLFLMVAAFVAGLPSTYVARLREHLTGKIAKRYPAPSAVEIMAPTAFSLKPDLQGSD